MIPSRVGLRLAIASFHIKWAALAATPYRYWRHQPETSLLYRIIKQYCRAFLAHPEAEGGTLADYVQQEFTDYLKSGRLGFVFLGVRCRALSKQIQCWPSMQV